MSLRHFLSAHTVALKCAVMLLFGGCAAPGYQRTGLMFQADTSGSWVSEQAGEPRLLRAFAGAARIHYQGERWGVGIANEANFFRVRAIDGDWDVMAAALYGLDVSYLSADGYVRSMISGGTTVLMEGTDIDEPGAIGFYLDTRPVTFRFQVRPDLLLAFCPLSGIILVPDPRGIPIVDAQFRANFSVEFF